MSCGLVYGSVYNAQSWPVMARWVFVHGVLLVLLCNRTKVVLSQGAYTGRKVLLLKVECYN